MSKVDPNISPFKQFLPDEQTHPVVINSPHSGAYYPASFLKASRLGNLAIRRSEDFAVDQMVKHASDHGMPVMTATYPRAFLDLNREPYELDQAMFDDDLPDFANQRSIRVSGGLGTVPRVVAEGEPIYRDRMPVSDAIDRINAIYRPYHTALQYLLARTHVTFDTAVLLDFHSMPSSSIAAERGRRADIVLGDRYSTSCDPSVLLHAKSILVDLGYDVSINKPYAGGFITEHYGRPQNGLHALQIEINRGLYMDETRIQKAPEFDDLVENMSRFFGRFAELDFDSLSGTLPLAAE